MTGRPDFAARRAARAERLAERADNLRSEGNAQINAADAIAARIPLGQPILVGHHSERRARRDAERIRSGLTRGFDKLKSAAELGRRASAAESNRAIDSDDPEALVKLREKLAKLEGQKAKLDGYRKALRKGGGGEQALLAMGVPQITADEMARNGIPSYLGTNLNAEIRRVKKRIAELEAAALREAPPDEVIGEIVIHEELNRVQLKFPGKPSEGVRSELKSHGFRWAPSEGAWQRKASSQAWRCAREIASRAASA